jgi:hypothetical protein
MDVSRSMDQAKFQLQRQGYAAAISDPQVLRAIDSGPHQKIAICFTDWSGPFEQRVVIDWKKAPAQAGAISRCKSGPGKVAAGRLEASVA